VHRVPQVCSRTLASTKPWGQKSSFWQRTISRDLRCTTLRSCPGPGAVLVPPAHTDTLNRDQLSPHEQEPGSPWEKATAHWLACHKVWYLLKRM
jgi:hypothetical protein